MNNNERTDRRVPVKSAPVRKGKEKSESRDRKSGSNGPKARMGYRMVEDVVLHGYNMVDKETLHEDLILKFGFPEYYGRNLDALHDMLTEWSYPTLIVLFGEREIIRNLGDYGRSFLKVLKASAEENDNLFFYSEERVKYMTMRKR